MFRLRYTTKAQKQVKKLPKEIQERVLAALERSRVRPYAFFEKLVGDWLYRLRVGKYRVLATIKNGELVILVVKVSHRKNVYRRKR